MALQCPVSATASAVRISTTVFPAGTHLTALSGEINSLSGVPSGCNKATFDIRLSPDHDGVLAERVFNPMLQSPPITLLLGGGKAPA